MGIIFIKQGRLGHKFSNDKIMHILLHVKKFPNLNRWILHDEYIETFYDPGTAINYDDFCSILDILLDNNLAKDLIDPKDDYAFKRIASITLKGMWFLFLYKKFIHGRKIKK